MSISLLWPLQLYFIPLILPTVLRFLILFSPAVGAADAEIKAPSVENTELEGSPFKAWGRLVYSHTWYANYKGFLPC